MPGGSFEWLKPLPMLCGIGLVLGYALLGAGWLILKSEGCVHSLSQSTTHFDRAGRYIVRPEIEGAATRKIETRERSQCQTRSRNRVPPPQCAVQAAGTASDPLFIAVVNQWGDAALLRKAKQDAADMTDKTHTILIAGVSDVGADARSSSFYLRTKGRNCVALEAVSSRPEIQCWGEGAPVVIPVTWPAGAPASGAEAARPQMRTFPVKTRILTFLVLLWLLLLFALGLWKILELWLH
jgi:hypothetical protein